MKDKAQAISVAWEKLTSRERAVLMYLFSTGQPTHISEIQEMVFGDLGTGTSPARNQLRTSRNLVAQGLVRKTRAGHYLITAQGRREVPGSDSITSIAGGKLERKPTMAASAKRDRGKRQSQGSR